MGRYAELDMLEMSLEDGYGWHYAGQYEGGGELALFWRNEPVGEWRAYEHDSMEGVQVLISPLELDEPMAVVVDEYRNIEKRCKLWGWDDDYDYAPFNAMLEDVYYERC